MAVEDPVGPWSTTVKDVIDLLPQAVIPEQLEAGRKGVTQGNVAGFIEQVSGFVSAKLPGRERLTSERGADLTAAARAVVAVGAASYTQAARYPEQSARNSDGYAAVLWDRYETALKDLAAQLAEWLTDPDDATPESNAGSITGRFPPPMFTDGFRF